VPTKIIDGKCNNCGICVYQCGAFVYRAVTHEQKIQVRAVNARACVECLVCIERCPQQAIELYLTGKKYFLN